MQIQQEGNSTLYLRLDGLTINNQLEINGSRHVEVRNSVIHTQAELNDLTASGGCVQVMNGQFVQILNTDISHCGVGISIMSRDFVVKGNKIHHVSHDAIKFYGGYNGLIEGNEIHDADDGLDDDDNDPDNRNNHCDGIHIHTIIHQGGYSSERWAGGADNIAFRGNLFYHIEAMAVMINQNDWDGHWGRFLWENNIFAPANGRLFIQGSSNTGFIFRNNTVLFAPNDQWTSMFGRLMKANNLDDPNSQYYHVQVWGNPAGDRFYNNILASASSNLVQDQGIVSNNIFIRASDSTLPYDSILGTIDEYILEGKLLGALRNGSPAIDGGSLEHPAPTHDIYGNTRDESPDIGAIEAR